MLDLGQHLIPGRLSGYHLGQVRLKGGGKLKIKLMSRYLTYNLFYERRVICGLGGMEVAGGFDDVLHSAARVHVMLTNLCMHIHELLIYILKV